MSQGEGGYEDNHIYTFSGIIITSKNGFEYCFKKGDVALLPKKEIPNTSQIFGFEINMTPKKEIEDAYFLTKSLYTLDELEGNIFKVFEKVSQVKIDQIGGPNTQAGKLLRNQEQISEDVRKFYRIICLGLDNSGL